MPVRGQRPVYPTQGKSPTGMFSRGNGKQKMDSTEKFPEQGLMAYAKGSGTRSKPVIDNRQGLRHQPPSGKK